MFCLQQVLPASSSTFTVDEGEILPAQSFNLAFSESARNFERNFLEFPPSQIMDKQLAFNLFFQIICVSSPPGCGERSASTAESGY